MHLRRLIVAATAACLLAAGLSTPVLALDPPPVPKDIPVVDQTNTLSDEQKRQLAAKIAAERKDTNKQLAILMIPSLKGDALEDYSLRVARGWGVGGKERNSGALLLVVKDDRKVRIEVGYGLEGALTDAQSSRIIRNKIAPQLREGKYYEGIDAGLTAMIAVIHGEKDAAGGSAATSQKRGPPLELILFGLFAIPAWLGSILARSKSWWAGGVIGGIAGVIIGFVFGWLFIGITSILGLALVGLLFDRAVSKNYQNHASHGENPSWWAGGPWIGGGGPHGGSGGFGGFGGGSFGGGGSSGDF